MRKGLQVVTKIGVKTNDVVTRKIGKDSGMESPDTFPNISRNKPEVVVRGGL